MANGITRETYDSMESDAKLGVLFDYAQQNYKAIAELQQQKTYHKWCATCGGVVGGILAALGIKWVS